MVPRIRGSGRVDGPLLVGGTRNGESARDPHLRGQPCGSPRGTLVQLFFDAVDRYAKAGRVLYKSGGEWRAIWHRGAQGGRDAPGTRAGVAGYGLVQAATASRSLGEPAGVGDRRLCLLCAGASSCRSIRPCRRPDRRTLLSDCGRAVRSSCRPRSRRRRSGDPGRVPALRVRDRSMTWRADGGRGSTLSARSWSRGRARSGTRDRERRFASARSP